MNLPENTNHESGIIIYGDKTVGVYNWQSIGDNEIPMISPLGSPVNWKMDNDINIMHVAMVGDVRKYLPGTVWMEDGELKTDLDIVWDGHSDIPGLFGFGPAADAYRRYDCPYSGDIWELSNGWQVITIKFWN